MTFLELVCLLSFPSMEHENIKVGVAGQIVDFLKKTPHRVYTGMGVAMASYFPDILELEAFQEHFKENIKKATEKEVYLVPDIFIAFNNKKEDFGANGYKGIPKMVIEIVSPGTARKDYGSKKEIYRYIGVEEYWVINDSENIVVNLLEENKRTYRETEYNLEEIDKDIYKGYLEIAVTVLPGLVISFDKEELGIM